MVKKITNNERKPWAFCETPGEKCTMNYCDTNGCSNRKRQLVDDIEKKDIGTFSETSKQLYSVYGQQSVLPILFGVASIFRDHIINETNGFPVLFLTGTHATGKTTLSTAIQHIFSNEKNILDGDCFTKLLAYKGIVILESNMSGGLHDEMIKNTYLNHHWCQNQDGSKRGLFVSLIVLSQKLPTDPMVLTRSILVKNDRNVYSETEKQKFIALHKKMETSDCNCISELTEYSEIVAYRFKGMYNNYSRFFRPFLSSKNTRMIKCFATLMAVYGCLKGVVEFPFNDKECWRNIGEAFAEQDMIFNLEESID